MNRGLLLALLLSCWGVVLHAQDLGEQRVSLSLRQTALEEALYQLIDRYGIPLSFSNSLLPDKQLTAEIKNRALPDVLDFLLDGTALAYRQVGRQIVLYNRRYEVPAAEEYVTISGYVRDGDTGEPLLSASVFDPESRQGTHTNAYGYFSLRLLRGTVQLRCSYLGYTPRTLSIDLRTDHYLEVQLRSSLVLEEVLVTASDHPAPEASSGYAVHALRADDATRLPALGGEPDLMRTAGLLPGVTSGADGFGGLYVRGGDVGHNLVLLDGVPVYNVSHAAGLFSIFNVATLQTATLTKGAAPARFGGRLSSVLDVRTRDGNNQAFSGQADVGLTSARLLVEGPLVKGKSSFLVAGRKSFLNWYLKPVSRSAKARNGERGATTYGFYDVHAKLNYRLSERDKLFLSLYTGDDQFANGGRRSQTLEEMAPLSQRPPTYRYLQQRDEHLEWGNTVGSLRWTHIFNPRLFATTAITYSRLGVRAGYQHYDSLYVQDTEALLGSKLQVARYRSGIEDLGARVDLEYQGDNRHHLRFGGAIHRKVFQPGLLQYDEATAELVTGDRPETSSIAALEGSLYADSDLRWGDRWRLSAGLRGSFFSAAGGGYFRFEPRFSVRFQATASTALRLAAGVHTQAVHLLSGSNLGLPIDLWVPSTEEVPPASAWQGSLGVVQSLPLGFSLQVEGYVKAMENLVAYSEGAYFANDWKENITLGEGRAYGLEVLLQRRQGKTRGWIAYTLARADRRFDLVNFGRTYPFRYDRRHEVKVAVRHRLSERLELSGTWIFGTGLAFSLPEYKLTYDYPGVPDQALDLYVFSEKNQNRLPANHRLDLGMNLDLPARGEVRQRISAGVYNLYHRPNPLYYDLRPKLQIERGELVEGKELFQVTLAPVLPYLSYSVGF